MGQASLFTSFIFPQSVAWETHLTNIVSSMWFLLDLSNIFPLIFIFFVYIFFIYIFFVSSLINIHWQVVSCFNYVLRNHIPCKFHLFPIQRHNNYPQFIFLTWTVILHPTVTYLFNFFPKWGVLFIKFLLREETLHVLDDNFFLCN